MAQARRRKIEIFTAGCLACHETEALVRRVAGANHDIEIHDMHQGHVAARAKRLGIRSLPSVVLDGNSRAAAPCGGPTRQF
jgi:hypothetical protein